MKKQFLSIFIITTMICTALPTVALAKVQTYKVHNSATLQLEKPDATGNATWKSSNKKVATVNKQGVVTGKKAGTCTITAKVGKITKKYKVKVPTLYENWKTVPDFGALYGLKEFVEDFDDELVEDAISSDADLDIDLDDEHMDEDSSDWMLMKTYKAKNAKQAKALIKKYEKRLKTKFKYRLEMKIWVRADHSTARQWKNGDISVTVGRVGKKIEILCMNSAKLLDEVEEELSETEE